MDPKKQELISKLKTGKTFLRNQELEKAFAEFKIALELAQSLGDPIEEKKAARGLGASLQRQGKYREAIQYHNMVLAISNREGEDSGSTEAYGAIADCYTELGDLEKAGSYYDTYIARLETDWLFIHTVFLFVVFMSNHMKWMSESLLLSVILFVIQSTAKHTTAVKEFEFEFDETSESLETK